MIDEAARAQEVVDRLDGVIDPELGIGIVSLGLIYKVGVDGDDVDVLMTLTVPGCPMHSTIKADVERCLRSIPWVRTSNVELTFEPPWTIERLSDAARKALGR
jgi:metal-sulfur cluster biosynthetic enzyme